MKKKIQFTKMAGAGNDFIIIDAIKGHNYKQLAKKVCNRTHGIGADGLIVCDTSRKADFRMRIINADGSEAEMCGNGARCLAAYIVANKKTKKKLFSVETLAGILQAEAKGEEAHVQLSNPTNFKDSITLTINKTKLHVSFMDTGVPHTLIFVNGLEDINVHVIGEAIRYHKKFQPKGTNVNFIEQNGASLINIRTYERGVEGETKACGTGSVAAALVTFLKSHPDCQNKTNAKMRVKTQSGEVLSINFDLTERQINNVWLKGSAKFIAKGEYYV